MLENKETIRTDTKSRTYEELNLMFDHNIATRVFRDYLL